MYYRSDWPEVGLPTALNNSRSLDFAAHLDDDQGWVQETKVPGAIFRWVATQSEFESNLYGLPIWNLHFEVDDLDGNALTSRLDSAILQKFVNEGVRQLSDLSPWNAAYVSTKLVKDEPLCAAFRQVGFREVEVRRVFLIRVRDIASHLAPLTDKGIRLTSLAEVASEQLLLFREQIRGICREVFAQGHSRHFTDPVLLERLPGVVYILAAMELNFARVAPDHFLIAIDIGMNEVCGFSVVTKRFGKQDTLYTQLLSAVRKTHQRRGIHRGLTRLITQLLPQDATLLNVVHVTNLEMQKVYRSKSRAKVGTHVADVSLLRRVFQADR